MSILLKMSEHIVSLKVYVSIFLALMRERR